MSTRHSRPGAMRTIFPVRENMMTRRHVVPDDFPREPTPGLLAGAQPKLLVRKTGGRYHTVLTDEELWIRYDACEDLASQLAEYASRKTSASGLSLDEALERVEKGLKAKLGARQWDFSRDEMACVDGGVNPHINGGARLTRTINNEAPLTASAGGGRSQSEWIADVVEIGILGRGTLFAQQVMQGEVIVHADPRMQILDEFDDGKRLFGRPVVRYQEVEPTGNTRRQVCLVLHDFFSARALLRLLARCSALSRASLTR
jgi:hypothetical protein